MTTAPANLSIADSLVLPCGAVLINRLAKAAMVPGEFRDRLTRGVYVSTDPKDITGVLEDTLGKVIKAETKAVKKVAKVIEKEVVKAAKSVEKTVGDAAKAQGKTAALLEQHLPNVFQMNVANIMPGDDVKVELRYTELLVPTDGKYQFVFPTVVGPRYRSPANKVAATEEQANGTAPSGR